MYRNTHPAFPRNHGKYWSAAERRLVRNMRHNGYTYGAIALRLKRTPQSIREMHLKLRGF